MGFDDDDVRNCILFGFFLFVFCFYFFKNHPKRTQKDDDFDMLDDDDASAAPTPSASSVSSDSTEQTRSMVVVSINEIKVTLLQDPKAGSGSAQTSSPNPEHRISGAYVGEISGFELSVVSPEFNPNHERNVQISVPYAKIHQLEDFSAKPSSPFKSQQNRKGDRGSMAHDDKFLLTFAGPDVVKNPVRRI